MKKTKKVPENAKDILIAGLDAKRTLKEIGERLGVSKQRVAQLLEEYNLPSMRSIKPAKIPPEKSSVQPRDYHRDRIRGNISHAQYWLSRTLHSKPSLSPGHRWLLFEKLKDRLPTHCPVLNIPLRYLAKGYRQDNSPSIDRIDSNVGYLPENVHIISWKANRLKSNATPEELRLVAAYFTKLENKTK